LEWNANILRDEWSGDITTDSMLAKLHGCASTHVESVAVHEVFRGESVWEGLVEVLDLNEHPKGKRCYAWNYQNGMETSCVTVLEIPPVKSPQTAVRAAIACKEQK